MSLDKPIARTIDEPARIIGFAPLELSACALFYAVLSPVLKGVPFAPLISLTIALLLGSSILILNRTRPPAHGVFYLLQLLRPKVVSVMGFGIERGHS